MKKSRRGADEVPGRKAIHAAAIDLFAEKGFAATTTREICQRAGVTKPVLYYHFGSKDQLYRELILDACNESRKQLALAAQKGRTAREKLVEALAADFAQTARNPGLSLMFFRMIFAPRKESPQVDYLRLGEEWVRFFAGIIGEGVRRGEMRGRPREIAEAFLGIHMICTMGYLLAGQPELDRKLARRMVNLLLKGCGNVNNR